MIFASFSKKNYDIQPKSFSLLNAEKKKCLCERVRLGPKQHLTPAHSASEQPLFLFAENHLD